MTLPEVPGIIEASMTITREPDGRLSLRVLVGAERGLIELIINPEDIKRSLHGEPRVFPCHIGFDRSVESPA